MVERKSKPPFACGDERGREFLHSEDTILILLALNRLIEPVFSYPRRALKSKFLSLNIEQIDSLSEVDQSLT